MVTSRDAAQVVEVLRVLRGVVGGLDPGSVPDGQVAELWAGFDGVERLAAAAKTLLARRVEECEIWRREGHRSAADYMAARAGGSIGSARASLATSKRLEQLPATSAAVRSGQLSSAQADRIADAASVNPEAEHGLLELADEASLRELDDACGRAKAAGDPDPDATYSRIHRQRRLSQSRDAEGAWCLFGRGTVDAGARFEAALEPIVDELFTQARADGRRETRERLAFDALIELARRGADTGAVSEATASSPTGESADVGESAATGHQAAGESPERTPAKRRRSREQAYLGLLRIDVEALQRGRVEGDELCEITGIGPVPVARARELLGDAVLKLVITKGIDVMNVTHLGRSLTVAQRTALLWQMPCCTAAGCSRTWVQHDHRIDWATTRHTRLDETDPLCHHDHDLKTRQGWALVAGKGKRAFVPPDDPRHPANSGPPDEAASMAAAPHLDNRRELAASF